MNETSLPEVNCPAETSANYLDFTAPNVGVQAEILTSLCSKRNMTEQRQSLSDANSASVLSPDDQSTPAEGLYVATGVQPYHLVEVYTLEILLISPRLIRGRICELMKIAIDVHHNIKHFHPAMLCWVRLYYEVRQNERSKNVEQQNLW